MKKLLISILFLNSFTSFAYLFTSEDTRPLYFETCPTFEMTKNEHFVCTMSMAITSFPTVMIHDEIVDINSEEAYEALIQEQDSEENSVTITFAKHFETKPFLVEAAVGHLLLEERKVNLQNIEMTLDLIDRVFR